MIKIYQFPSCPFCQKVFRKIKELNLTQDIDFQLIEAYPNSEGRAKIIKLGGKSQVPFMTDSDNNTKMYESDEIIKYLENKFKDNPSK